MNETLEIIQSEFAQASFETFEMVLISMIAAAILGTILGLVLHLASNPIFYKNRVVNGITGTIINVIRSLPFIILIIVLQPLARLVVGTSIGPIAASVSLAIAAIAFYARLVEGAFSEVDKGVIEAAVATGASMPLIIRKVLFVEATPALVRALTVTFVSVIGYSAMAGAVGRGIEAAGKEAEVVDVSTADMDALKASSVFAMGCPAMGAEVLEEGEMEPFVEEVEGFAAGKKIALFGSYGWGDGQWMRDWVDRMTSAGATVVNGEGVICQEAPDDDAVAACESLGKQLAGM